MNIAGVGLLGLIVVLFAAACATSTTSGVVVDLPVVVEPTCASPFIESGEDCCLDTNNNQECDKDEKDFGIVTKETVVLAEGETCRDTDGGINAEEFGSVVTPNGVFEDRCSGTILREYYCREDGKMLYRTINCGFGKFCQEGVCSE